MTTRQDLLGGLVQDQAVGGRERVGREQEWLTTKTEAPVTIICPSHGWIPLKYSEIWQYRELLYFLIWRDLKVRYKQTAIGVAWAVIQPFFTMVVFSVLFGKLAKMPSDGIPYPVFAYCGLLPWQLFAHALTESGNSLVANQHLLTKVYFPRLIIPLAAVVVGMVDFGIAFIMLVTMMAAFHVVPTWAVVTLPCFLLLALATALAAGLWLSALNVRYRDVRYTIPFLIQLWFFVTPIVYPTSLIPPSWRALYALNPMAGVVEGFRWALLGRGGHAGPWLAVSSVVTLILLIGGLYYFRRVEQTFADVV